VPCYLPVCCLFLSNLALGTHSHKLHPHVVTGARRTRTEATRLFQAALVALSGLVGRARRRTHKTCSFLRFL